MFVYPAYNLEEFKSRLTARLKALQAEAGHTGVVLPVGLFLVIDEDNGGDATAQELVKRFHLLDQESREVIDFYFLGWVGPNQPVSPGQISPDLHFDLNAFERCRRALQNAGVQEFGGNADLLLVDAQGEGDDVTLDFSGAIRVDLSRAAAEGKFASLGQFLQTVVDAAESLKKGPEAQSPVYAISDKLGLAIAKESLLDWFLKKWGEAFGADRLASVAVRNLGPDTPLAALRA